MSFATKLVYTHHQLGTSTFGGMRPPILLKIVFWCIDEVLEVGGERSGLRHRTASRQSILIIFVSGIARLGFPIERVPPRKPYSY